MGVLLMATTFGGVIAAAVLFVIALFTGKAWLRKFVLGGVAVWFVFYAVMLIGFSLTSTERNIAVGDTVGKAFCGFYLDCHMHTAVTGVRTAKSIGGRTANGEFYIVKLQVFSDARRAVLGLHTVDAHVVDGRNQQYSRDIAAEQQLPPQPPFEKQVGPGESFEKEVVFDLPAGAQNPRLDIAEGFGIDKVIEFVLVGDEDSVLHKRNYFDIREQTQTASQDRER